MASATSADVGLPAQDRAASMLAAIVERSQEAVHALQSALPLVTEGQQILRDVEVYMQQDFAADDALVDHDGQPMTRSLLEAVTAYIRDDDSSTLTEALSLDDDAFMERFRVRHSTYNVLCDELQYLSVFTSRNFAGRPPLEFSKALLMVLERFGNSLSVRDLAKKWAVADSSVVVWTRKICEGLLRLAPTAMGWRTEQELSAVMDKFRSHDPRFEHCCGVLGATNIPISVIPNNPPLFLSSQQIQGSVIQAVCDADLRFRDVATGFPGSYTDSRCLQLSPLSGFAPEKFDRGYLLGGHSYPLRRWLLTPFANPQNQQQHAFNESHASLMRNSSLAFGLLKRRWRRLEQLDVSFHEATITIMACCVLHNLCIDVGDVPAQFIDSDPHHSIREYSMDIEAAGAERRDGIAARFGHTNSATAEEAAAATQLQASSIPS